MSLRDELRAAMLANIYRMCALITAGAGAHMALSLSRKIAQAVRVLISADIAAYHAQLKRAMLASPHWRARVVQDLGGRAALMRWERKLARLALLDKHKVRVLSTAIQTTPQTTPQATLLSTAQRAAYDRRASMGAGMAPRIFTDWAKLDRNGQFRLAPLPRLTRRAKPDTSSLERHREKSRRAPRLHARGWPPAQLHPYEFHSCKLRRSDIGGSIYNAGYNARYNESRRADYSQRALKRPPAQAP